MQQALTTSFGAAIHLGPIWNISGFFFSFFWPIHVANLSPCLHTLSSPTFQVSCLVIFQIHDCLLLQMEYWLPSIIGLAAKTSCAWQVDYFVKVNVQSSLSGGPLCVWCQLVSHQTHCFTRHRIIWGEKMGFWGAFFPTPFLRLVLLQFIPVGCRWITL